MKLSEILRIAKENGWFVSIEFKWLVWAGRNYVFGKATDRNVQSFASMHRDSKWDVEMRNGKVIVATCKDF